MNSASAVLILLLWPWLLLTNAVLIQQLKAPVGQPFTFSLAEGHAVDAEMLPSWCRFNNSGRLIYGIPQLSDVGPHLISIHDAHMDVQVAEEEDGLCGPDSGTIWLELMDFRRLVSLPMEEQFKAVQTLLFALKEEGVQLADVRLFPRSYLGRYRTVTETIHRLGEEDEEGEKIKDPGVDDRTVFVLNISCGELTEQASEVISAVAEDGLAFQVVEGELRKDRPRLTTTTSTAASTTSGQHTRTTRRVHNNNNRPIVLNPLKSFHCVRGILCRIPIDENTFMDAEDGQTSRLTLSVHATGNHSNFLAVVPGANMLEGVPMEEANDAFSFRLEARDRHNMANSAPFQVFLKPMAVPGRPSHRYSMILDTPLERFSAKPELLRDFVYKLSAALRRLPAEQRSQEWAEAAAQVHVEQLADNGASQTLLKWWNASLSRAICEEERINITRDRMVHPGTDRLRHEFVKQMGAQFHVRKVSTELLGKCLTRHLLDQARIRVFTTTQRNPMLEDRQSSTWANQLLIPLILLVTILLLCTVLTLLCCAHHKRGKKGAGKRNEFTTKAGRPVVFPDEVPHRDESSSADGSLATVTTPMLVEREQPPLDPTKMTMHENPLYRPPPQVQAQLLLATRNSGNDPMRPQQQQQSPPPPTLASTFSPPSSGQLKPIDASPTPLRANPFLREHPHQQSTRFHATPVGQRLPPPYVAH